MEEKQENRDAVLVVLENKTHKTWVQLAMNQRGEVRAYLLLDETSMTRPEVLGVAEQKKKKPITKDTDLRTVVLETNRHKQEVTVTLHEDGSILACRSKHGASSLGVASSLGIAEQKPEPGTFKVGDWIEYEDALNGETVMARLVRPMARGGEPQIALLNGNAQVSRFFLVRNVNKIREDELENIVGSKVRHVPPTPTE